MKLLIALFIFASANQALSFNWFNPFKQTVERPEISIPSSLPTRTPIFTPQRRPIVTPSRTRTIIPKLRRSNKKATPTPAPIRWMMPFTSPSPKIDNSAESFLAIENEIMYLFEGRKLLGPDHYKRLQFQLDRHASLGVNPEKIAKLKGILETLDPAKFTSKPMPVSPDSLLGTPIPTYNNQPQTQSQPQLQPTQTPDNPPVIKNLGINFESAFVFLQSENKLFLEYGAEVASSEGGTKILPTFEYRTAAGADVFAISDGIVRSVTYQDRTSDYQIHILPRENSKWTIEYDHINNPKVLVGNRVGAGDIIGKVGNLGGSLGRTEIMLWESSPSRPVTYCPLKYFDQQLLLEYKQKILKHIKDWEDFKGNSNIYSEEKHILPGCAYESLLD